MIHVGIGPYQVVNFLTSLNIPTIAPKCLKDREREILHSVESCASESCEKALEEEIRLTSIDE